MQRGILGVTVGLVGLAALAFGAPLVVVFAQRPGGTSPLWLAIVAAGGLALLAAALAAARMLSRRLAAPLEDLAAAARAWQDGAPHEPVAATGSPDFDRLVGAFNELGARMTVLLQRQRAFVSYASHQLRTPLATLRLGVENVRAQYATGPEADDFDLLIDEIDRMTRICDSLLAYARAEATAAEPADLDLAGLAAKRVEMWEPAAAMAGVELVRGGADGVRAWTAEAAVSQCLDALIDNAVKYAGPGSRVVVAAYRLPGGWAQLDVIDNGPGLSEAELAAAGQAFWRRPGDEHHLGSGLGVTIAGTLVTASGGTFALLPARPRGLRVHMRLPAWPRHDRPD